MSDREVFKKQQRAYDIVTMNPKQYEEGIKMFPKLRNEIKEDEGNKMRKAFIMGRPEMSTKNSKERG